MRLTLLLIVFSPVILYGQINNKKILGTWIKVKAEMEDGSRIVERPTFRVPIADRYSFLGNGTLEIASSDLYSYTGQYAIKRNLLNLQNVQFYNIITLTNDSLIIQDADKSLDGSKLKRYYFIKLETYHNNDKPQYNVDIRDSVYQISKFVLPISKIPMSTVPNFFSRFDGMGHLKLSFIISKSGKVEDARIIKNDSLSNDIAQKVMSTFEDTAFSWKPALVSNKPVNVVIEVCLDFSRNYYAKSKYVSHVNISLPVVFEPNLYKSLSLGIVIKEHDIFNDAVRLAKRHKYDKAVEMLTQCLDMDDIHLDAYYLRSAIYFETGNKSAACNDWQKLAQLGQVLATEYLIKYCNN